MHPDDSESAAVTTGTSPDDLAGRTRPLDVLRFSGALLSGGVAGLARRLVSGPLRPAWSLRFETVVAIQRASYEMLSVLGPVRFRQVSDRLSPSTTAGVPRRRFERPDCKGHWLIPADESGPVILYFHGGGYVFGSLRTHGNLMGSLARTCGTRLLALDYRLGPEHRYPAAVEDACAAFRYLLDQGVPAEKIVLAGDSAGGNLVLVALLALRDTGGPMPAAGVALSPWTDLDCSGASFETNAAFDFVTREACLIAADGYLGGVDPRSPGVSPLYAELSGMPPVLVHAGGAEVLLDQILDFVERSRAVSNKVELSVYDDMVHVWQMLLGIVPEAQKALDEIATFVHRHT